MGRVTLTAEMLAKLADVKESVELRDENGRVIGFFDPVPRDVPGGWGPFTAEQVERAKRREGPYRTLEEIYREHGPK